MRKVFLIVVLFFYSCAMYAQAYDMQWVLGPNASVLDFENDTIGLRTLPRNIPFYLTSACISDEEGNLLYTCYGSCATDKNGDTLLNGNDLSPCQYTDSNPDGFAIQQAAMFLPMPGNSEYYYLFHFSGDTDGRPATMYYSIINKEGNGGLGEIVKKNNIYYKSIFRNGGMTACKHANRRDWWIVIGKFNSNGFYKFLLTPSGIADTLLQNIGPVYHGPLDNAYSCFSPDGSKYVTGTFGGLVTVLDFDRCTGEFSNLRTISNAPDGQTGSGECCVAFSPNGRFVYVSDRVDLNQYDLSASNIQDSVEVYSADDSDYAQIHFLQLAPNGKLYGSTWDGGFYFLHVVNNPDLKGDSCGFVWGGQPTLSGNSFNLPNMPNYRLGALIGSGCDTITSISNEAVISENGIRVMPNPADKYVYVEMAMQGNYEFDLLNEFGQVVDRKETRQVDIFDTEYLASGVYFVKAAPKSPQGTWNTNTMIKKLIITH